MTFLTELDETYSESGKEREGDTYYHRYMYIHRAEKAQDHTLQTSPAILVYAKHVKTSLHDESLLDPRLRKPDIRFILNKVEPGP